MRGSGTGYSYFERPMCRATMKEVASTYTSSNIAGLLALDEDVDWFPSLEGSSERPTRLVASLPPATPSSIAQTHTTSSSNQKNRDSMIRT
jgi:hypothetical protein